MTRALKRLVCHGLIGLMLFTQLAVAAYACPSLLPSGLQVEQAAVSTASEAQAMPGGGVDAASARPDAGPMTNCDQMAGTLDKASPNLCAEHCRHGQQSDQTQTLTAPAVMLVSLYIVSAMQQALPPIRQSAASADLLAAASPPLAILHCRFRA